MADWGAKVSLPGKDVSSSTPEDFAFHSKYGTVKIVKQPTDKAYETKVVSASSTATVTIAHNLGFIPLCMVFAEMVPGSGRWYMGVSYPSEETFGNTVTVGSLADGTYADDTNLYIFFTNNKASEQTVKYYYYIFGEAGS